jgi:hypothetical protein
VTETAQDRAADRRTQALCAAVRRTLAYADLFDYPLSAHELHRYLHDTPVTLEEMCALLADGVSGVEANDGYYALAGRLWTVAERQRRAAISARLTGRLWLYTKVLKYLPFVRMVALTGSLSMQNVDGRVDIDLMVITAVGRVWLGRAAVILVVRLARLAHDSLCPNFVVAENALELGDPSIYGAHELAQMVPLCGRDMYHHLWASNPHLTRHLPNARARPMPDERLQPLAQAVKQGAERLLGGAVGDWLERWERRRKIARLNGQQATPTAEIVLSADQCKGHFDRHRARVLAAYQDRLVHLDRGESPSPAPQPATARDAGISLVTAHGGPGLDTAT